MFEYLYNIHKYQTGVVIGNGPSLKDVPNEFLDFYPTIGCNRVYLKYVPAYYIAINELVIRQYKKDIENLPCNKFIRENTGIKNCFSLHLIETPMFSFSPTKWLYDGHNTTFVALQLAFFLGFSKVMLVGVDHRYEFDGAPNQELQMEGDDPNHFDPNYFKGKRWQAPDLEVSRKAYLMAKEAYETNGREIVNITPSSSLDVFKFEEVVWPS